MARLLKTGLLAGAAAATGILCLLTLLGFLARWTQPFELISHFRLHYAAALLALACLWAGLRAWRALALAVSCFCLNAAAIATALLPSSAPETSSAGSRVRILWANLEKREASLSLVAQLARSQSADIVALTELPAGGADAVRKAFADFACFTSPTGLTTLTTMIASRAPCSRMGEANGLPRPSEAVYVDVEGLRVVALHPRPPGRNQRTAERNAVIRGAVLLGIGLERAVVIGDFNATPWSPILIDVTREGFRRASCGAPFSPTWRSGKPLLELTIDHAYLYGDVAVAGCRVGPDNGSDHLPLIVDVSTRVGGLQASRLQH